MEYAIIETGGKQYKVTPGMVLDIDRIPGVTGKISFEKVLLYVNDSSVKLGKPYISGMAVAAQVVGEKKGEKVRVSKFKAKSKYRRSIGFRASLTSVTILPFGGKEEVKPKASKTK